MCDSSPLISFSDTCNIGVLRFLKSRGGRFFVPPGVQSEIVSAPMRIRKYQFSAVRLKKTLDDGVLELFDSERVQQKTVEAMDAANSLLRVQGKPLKLVHQGEAECIGAYSEVGAHALLIDEKTTRMLIENPFKLVDVMQGEYGSKIEVDEESLAKFRELTKSIFVMRSAEALVVAAKRGFFEDYGADRDEALQAALYSLRESGCSITTGELEEYEKMKL